MTHHSDGKQEALPWGWGWGRKSEGCHTSGQYPSYQSSVVILNYPATPKHSMSNHPIRKEDGLWVYPGVTFQASCDKELLIQPRARSTDPLSRWCLVVSKHQTSNLKAQRLIPFQLILAYLLEVTVTLVQNSVPGGRSEYILHLFMQTYMSKHEQFWAPEESY